MNRQRFLPLALGLITLARFLLLAMRELSPVEAHAAMCASVPSLWHPLTGPVLPLWMKVSTTFFGMNEFGVRFFAPLLMLGAGWLVWKISLSLFDATTAAWAALLFQITPAVNLAAIHFTNTTLAIAGSTAMLAVLRLALHRSHRFHLHWWVVSGVSALMFFTDWRLGLAMGVSSAASLTLTRRGRSALMKWPVLPILGVCFFLGITIFLAWNTEHNWGAFAFFPDKSAHGVVAVLHSVFFGYGLLLFPVFIWAIVETTVQRQLSYASAYLYAFAWPLLTLDLISRHTLDWPQIGFAAWVPPLVMLTAHLMMQTERLAPRIKVWARSALVMATAAQSCFIVQTENLRALGIHWHLDSESRFFLPPDPMRHMTGWRDSAHEIISALDREGLRDKPFFLVAKNWQLAAPLAFYLRDIKTVPRVQVLPDEKARTPFADWPRFDYGKEIFTSGKATAVFITDESKINIPPKSLRNRWPAHHAIAIFRVERNGMPVRTLKVFACSPVAAADK